MALIKKLNSIKMDRNSVHGTVDATYSSFQDKSGVKYLQIDTYGSRTRKIPGKKSQSIQLGPEAQRQLKDILRSY